MNILNLFLYTFYRGFLELLHDREKDYKRDLEDEDQMNEGRKIMLDRVAKLKHKDIDTKSTELVEHVYIYNITQ